MITVGSVLSMPTRPCDHSLGLQDDSVFIDLNIDNKKCFYLVRISFDGYGCCRLSESEQRQSVMNLQDSQRLKLLLDSRDFNNPSIGVIIGSFLHEIKDLVWEDALREHNLI